MSAQPVYRPVKSRRSRSESVTVRNRRKVVRRNRRNNGLEFVLACSLLFLSTTAVTFGFSTLIGHSMMENARHQANKASDRSRVAKSDLARLRNRVESLYAMKRVDEWSRTNGFRTAYEFAPAKSVTVPAKLVAVKSKPSFEVAMSVVRSENNVVTR